ncbi:MAG: nitroreductase family deazaflavin-dependent oxidoreductase [Acidimicrobiia bacterium]
MALEGTYEPSAWSMIADQVQRFEETDGREGNELEGRPCIILWTRGRHSGAVRKTPLMRVTDGERYAVVASLGGAPKHPVWYLNLANDPNVSLQDCAELHDYVARTVEGDERTEWWKRATEVWPAYDGYQANTDRVIPVVVLDPA